MAFKPKLISGDYLNGLLEIVETSEHEKKLESDLQNYKNSILLNNEPQDLTSYFSLIPHPFAEKEDADMLSLIFHRYTQNTDIPVSLPIFSLFSYISAFLTKNDAMMRVPHDRELRNLDTWVMLLAPSGAAKTLSSSMILKTIPKNLDGEPLVKSNFEKGTGAASFIKGLSELPGGKGLWIEDEASQLIKKVEAGGSMEEAKEYILKARDNQSLTRKTKKDEIKTEKIVLTTLFINTIDSMSKSLSDESMKDGLIRRFPIAYADFDQDRDVDKFPLYQLDLINDKKMFDTCDSLFKTMLEKFQKNMESGIKNQYVFSQKCEQMYNKFFSIFWNKYKSFMHDSRSMFRTYVMESFKYAIFYHEILEKEGMEIDEEGMEWGLKTSAFMLESYKKFLDYRATGGAKEAILKNEGISEKDSKILKMRDWLIEAEKNSALTMRDFQRRFTLKKAEAIDALKTIKINTPKMQSKLFKKIEV